MKIKIFIGIVLFSLINTSFANLESAMSDYKQGDYKEAYLEFKRLASLGNTTAQNNLGFMYDKGHGLQQDYQQAVYWHRKGCKKRTYWRKKSFIKNI
jgi:TPR repeat protein